MSMDSIPSVALGTGTVLLVVMAMEAGYRLGRAVRRRSKGEKESSVSSIEASILGLLAFMLAFTFGIVSDRYQDRKELGTLTRDEQRDEWTNSMRERGFL